MNYEHDGISKSCKSPHPIVIFYHDVPTANRPPDWLLTDEICMAPSHLSQGVSMLLRDSRYSTPTQEK